MYAWMLAWMHAWMHACNHASLQKVAKVRKKARKLVKIREIPIKFAKIIQHLQTSHKIH